MVSNARVWFLLDARLLGITHKYACMVHAVSNKKMKAKKQSSKSELADKVLKNGTTRPLRKRIQETCMISLDAFGACVGKLVNRVRLSEAIRRSFELIGLFEASKTERKFFVVTTQTDQKRRGTFAGIC